MDIRRFGPGQRRPEGPPGTTGITGKPIYEDGRGLVAELAFARHAMIAPHSNPNTALFVVISGGGYVQVGEERARISHGEAVVWPAGVPHGAYTEGTEMRAIVVELSGADDARARGIIEGSAAHALVAGESPGVADEPGSPSVSQATGSLAEIEREPEDYDRSSGEPL
ncbi:MAG TPA: cupin domain-containing protein [Candidatus Limnocylindrales bacterium]|nr:cupin domain-containing protein [Candidatus Limnocylindrales bacterium]